MPEPTRTIMLTLYHAARLALACAPNDDMYRVLNSLIAQCEVLLDLPRQARVARAQRHHSTTIVQR